MSGLVLKLSPKERVLINGAVTVFDDRAVDQHPLLGAEFQDKTAHAASAF